MASILQIKTEKVNNGISVSCDVIEEGSSKEKEVAEMLEKCVNTILGYSTDVDTLLNNRTGIKWDNPSYVVRAELNKKIDLTNFEPLI